MLTKTHGLIALCQVFVALSGVYLVVGLIKPKWVWLGEKEPGRQMIVAIALFMFMASWSGYSALALKTRKDLLAEQQQQAAEQAKAAVAAAQPAAEPAKAAAVVPQPAAEAKPEAAAPATPTVADKPAAAQEKHKPAPAAKQRAEKPAT